jgi:hypothetical protein
MIGGDCAFLACDVAVRRALEVASKRMLTRATRGRTCIGMPSYLVYTCLPAVTDPARLNDVLRDAWNCLPEEMEWLLPALDQYVKLLLGTGIRHDQDELRERMLPVAEPV